MMPSARDNGKALRELFAQPDQWKETRALVDALGYTDLNFNKQFTDDELKAWFAKMAEWKLKLGLEVGAIKPWGLTGEKTFAIESWIGAPSRCLPGTGEFTFTRSVLDFVRRFVRTKSVR
jgi:hypothetical protein